MQLEVNDLSKYGVKIYGPSSPAFSNRLSALVTIPNDLLNDALKYSIVVENQTSQHIIAMSVVWNFYPPQGEPIKRSHSFSFMGNQVFNKVSDSLIRPGEQYPLSLLLESAGFGRQKAREIKLDDQVNQRLEGVNMLIARSVKWSVDIDGVLFSNGVFVGSDTLKYFNALDAQTRGARDMITELAKRLDAGEDVFAFARPIAEVTDEALEAPYPDRRERMRNPEYIYNLAKTQMARQAVARRKNYGEQTVIEWIRENSKSYIPLVKK
jgi:hypothetical protein